MTRKRPGLLVFTTGFFLMAGLVSLIELIGSITSWNWILYFSPIGGLVYRVFKSAFLFLSLVLAGIVLWKRLLWSITYSSVIATITAVWYWVDRTLISNNPQPINRQLFPFGLTLLFLTFILLSLHFLLPCILSYRLIQQDPPGNVQLNGGKHE